MSKFKIEIRSNWCKGCGICVAFCPKDVLEMDTTGKACVKNIEQCIGCKMCELRCPDYAVKLGGNDVE